MDRQEPVWEPWRPRLGQRVRIRLNGECPLHSPGGKGKRMLLANGRVGKVDDIADWPGRIGNPQLAGHRYAVLFERPRPDGMFGACFAAIELEPVEEAAS